MRFNVSDISETHPWARERPCIESRMLGNLHVRFGKRDGETCLRKEMERFISTFTVLSISLDGEMIFECPTQCCKVIRTV
jgi:hypothetical protein